MIIRALALSAASLVALGATAVEMEGAAVVQTCRQFAVPCLVVRGITDRADTEASSNYRQFIGLAEWLTIPAGLAISLTVLSINILGDWLRDFIDPRLKNIM